MQIVSDFRSLAAALENLRGAGKRIALVPTMGNLHEGHLALVRQARTLAEFVVATLFVNPMQFDRADDLVAYPRTFDRDVELLKQERTDLLFAPSIESVYPRGLKNSTYVEVPGLSGILCGADRPGHFRGVATVVTILLNAVKPDIAIFGEKDYQQLLIIRRLAEDLATGVRIVAGPTVREADGLAMSSRNAYLTPEERCIAPALYRTLQMLARAVVSGSQDYPAIEIEGVARLAEAGFAPDYVAVRRAEDLMPPGKADRALRLLAAARLGKARLIDNVCVERNSVGLG